MCWIKDNIVCFGGDLDCIVIVGYLVGGYIVVMFVLDLQWLVKVGVLGVVKVVVGLLGLYDFYFFIGCVVEVMGQWFWLQEMQLFIYVCKDVLFMMFVIGIVDMIVCLKNVCNLVVKFKVFGVMVEEKEYVGQGYEDIVMVLLLLFCSKLQVFGDMMVFLNVYFVKVVLFV